MRPSFDCRPFPNLQLQPTSHLWEAPVSLNFLGNGQLGKSNLTRAGLLLLIPRRGKRLQQRLAAWRRLSRWDAARRCPGWRSQPGTGDGGRDETYCSYLEHAPQLAAASKKPKKSSGSQTGAHLLTFPRRFGQGPLLLLFGV